MARIGASLDLGEELDAIKSATTVKPAQEQTHKGSAKHERDSSSATPESHKTQETDASQELDSKSKETHDKDVPRHDRAAREKREWKIVTTLPGKIILAILLLGIVMYTGLDRFSATSSFPGVDKAIETQALSEVHSLVSKQIAADYKSVSDVRKKYMYQEKYKQVSESQEVKDLIKTRQDSTKDLFRDEQGLPYLYTPDSYRYAIISEPGMDDPTRPEAARFTDQDRSVGRGIARFSKVASGFVNVKDSAWASVNFPVFIGMVCLLLTVIGAFLLSHELVSILFTGILAGMHPLLGAVFCAGIPHPSILPVAPMMVALVFVFLCAGARHAWVKWIGLGFAVLASLMIPGMDNSSFYILLAIASGCIGGSLLSSQRKTWGMIAGAGLLIAGIIIAVTGAGFDPFKLKLPILLTGRVIFALCLIGTGLAVYRISKKTPCLGLASAAGAFIPSLLISPLDSSQAILPLMSTVLSGILLLELIGPVSSIVDYTGLAKFPRVGPSLAVVFIALLLVAASSEFLSKNQTLVLPGIDDSQTNVSYAIIRDGGPRSLIVTDPVSADPAQYFSQGIPVVSNTSDTDTLDLFGAMMVSRNDSMVLEGLKTLACKEKDNLGKNITDNCTTPAYLLLTDRTFKMIDKFAAQTGMDLRGESTSAISACQIMAEGGIGCSNGFILLDLNATRNGLFPQRMVSFVGATHVVDYPYWKIPGTFVIYRENGRLFSFLTPSQLDSTFALRAFGHEKMPFLKEIAASDNPTHTVAYRIIFDSSEKGNKTNAPDRNQPNLNRSTSSRDSTVGLP